MPDGHEPGFQSLIAAAESAAADGDLRRTESLFREAVLAQEQELGPAHPGLASTCNNLAVVCERAGHYDDAEYYYRRAHAIAVSLLDPKDPAVQTSFDNLSEFCQARGLPLDDWPEIAARANHAPPLGGRPASLSTVPRPRPTTQPSPAAQRVAAPHTETQDAEVADLFGVYAASTPAARPAVPVQSSLRTTVSSRTSTHLAETPSTPTPAPAPAAASLPRPVVPSSPAPAAHSDAAATTGPPARRAASRGLVAMLIAAGVVATTAVVWWRLPSSAVPGAGAASRVSAAAPSTPIAAASSPSETSARPDRADREPASPPLASPQAAPSVSAQTAPVKAARTPASTLAAPVASAVAEPTSAKVATPASPEPRDARTSAVAAPAVHLRVVTTGVCTTLDTRASPWRCAPVGDGTVAGPITYYTRITNRQARMRVEHRWYRDDVLALTRSLSLAYSPTEGYRTYSRYSPAPGRWRVELVGPDGAVLHDARFEVR